MKTPFMIGRVLGDPVAGEHVFAHYEIASGDLDAGFAADTASHERRVDLIISFRPGALHERQIPFVDLPFAQQLVQHSQGAAAFREQQAARRSPIEAMSQLEVFARGAQQAQGFDDAQTNAAAAMDGEPGRLVDDEEPRVLINDALAEPVEAIRRRDGHGGRPHSDGGHPHPVTGL